MDVEDLFHEKEYLVEIAIKQRFKGLYRARMIANMNNMELDDLFQVGRMALWNLCKKYDPSREGTFNAYAIQSIKWGVLKEVHMKGLPIYIPSAVSWDKRQSFQFHSTDLHVENETINDYFAVSPEDVEQTALNRLQIEEAFQHLESMEQYILIQKGYERSDSQIGKMLNKSLSFINKAKREAIVKIKNESIEKAVSGN